MLLFQTISSGIVNGMIYVLLALGLTLTFGIGRVINFAHGEFYMLGAFAAYLVIAHLHLPYIVSLLVAAMVIAVVGVVTNRVLILPVQRKESSMWAPFLITLALMTIFQSLALIAFGPDPYLLPSPFANKPFNIGGIHLSQQDLFAVIISLTFSGLLVILLKRTNLGLAMRAVARDSDAACLMGINIQAIKSVTFALGTGLAAVAGVLLIPQAVLDPYVGRMALLKGLAVVILGGLGDVYGAILGGLLLGLAEALGSVYISVAYKDAIGYLLMIVVLLFRPQGIIGQKTRQG